jgi:hypothetical protein
VAEADAMALKEFVMDAISTKADISGLKADVSGLGEKIENLRKEFEERFATKDELRHEIGLLRKDVDAMGLKLTVRMGGMLAIAVGAVAAIGKVL